MLTQTLRTAVFVPATLILVAIISLFSAGPVSADSKFGPYYPDDAAIAKSVLSSLGRAASTLSFSVVNDDPTTTLMVVDPDRRNFCWSPPFEAGARVFLKGKRIGVRVPLYCENGQTGTGSIKGRGRSYMVNIRIEGGPSFKEKVSFKDN
ncbi:hypothetical protein [Aliiruegeria sabulilitoris]|uniref:hypothetical protein n=1 Tax=Aliiruegeria sabulilitoris TaxID=1510458 RepID=UPI0008335407|nr:hypothetical protein [Aliiruegeria sabulilitoris]NDR57964.1 hypothetical protein [Pseudoruegeria sp. M32A2M]